MSWIRDAMLVGVFCFGGMHAAWYVRWMTAPTYTIRDINSHIVEAIGDNKAVVVGRWAPWLVFDTPYVFYYVKRHFNTSPRTFRRLGVTHLVRNMRKDPAKDAYARVYPKRWKRRRLLGKYLVRGTRVRLYDF